MRKKDRFKLRKLFVFFLSITLLILHLPVQVAAAGGDFALDFAAAAPYSYNHLTGGGAYDDGTIGSHADVVESLEGGDFRCGDIVTYLTRITVDDTDSADADAPQTIQLDFAFLADTTGQSGVAIIDIKTVKINYGTISDLIPGEDNLDSGNKDDGGSQATLVDEHFTGTPFTTGALLKGSVLVDDLERGETVILRIDVKLGCKPGSDPTGNLQADLQGAWLVATGSGAVDPPKAISSGQQTVPFKQIGDIGAADLEIDKTVRLVGSPDPFSESISVLNGTAVEYRYVVENLAATQPPGAPLYDVTVVDDNGTPANTGDDFFVPLTGLSDIDGDGHADDLAIGATAIGMVTRTITTTQDTVTNTAEASGKDSLYMPNTLTDSDTATVLVKRPSLELDKSGTFDAGTDGLADPGERITYTFVVRNTGNVPLTNVTVTDPLLGPITLSGTTIAVGSQVTGTKTYAVSQADINVGFVYNLATADSEETAPDDDDHHQPLPRNPLLELEKTGAFDDGDDGFADPGELITYTFVVRNIGNVTLTNVAVTDPLLGSITLSGTTIPVGGQVTGSKTYSITQADIDAGYVDNLATADSEESGPDDDDHHQPLPQNPLLELVKTGAFDAGSDGFADPGELITYTFVVRNTGNVTLTHVTVTDPLLGSITLSGTTIPVGGQVTGSKTYAVTQADINAGHAYNLATADSDESESDDDDHHQPLPQNPDIELEKTGAYVDENADGMFSAGDKITYTFTVRNTGNVTLTHIILTDPLITVMGGPIACLEPGEMDSSTFSGVYWLTQADLDRGTFTNLATVTGTPPFGEDVMDTDDDMQQFVQSPMLELDKTGVFDAGLNGFADLGELITYTFIVRNTGNVTLTNVTITDPMLGAITLSGTTIPVDGQVTGTKTYAVTQADIDAGFAFNLATADSDESGPDDDEHHQPLPQNPLLELEKTGAWVDGDGDGWAQAGETVIYTFTVSNIGNVTLHDVTVTDPKIPALIYVSGDDGGHALQIDETWIYTAEYQLTQADVDAGFVDNVALADSGESDEDEGDETIILPQNASIRIMKLTDHVEGPDILVGHDVHWQYIVTNTGNVTLSDITVVDDQGVIPVYISGDLNLDNLLDLDETWIYEAAGMAVKGDYVNIGTATGLPPEGEPVSDEDESHYFGYELGIHIEKDVANLTREGQFADYAELVEDETAQYRLTIINQSNVSLTNIIVTDTHAAPGTVVTISGGGTLTWSAGIGGLAQLNLGSLAAGTQIVLTYDYRTLHSDIGDVIINTAAVSGEPGEEIDLEVNPVVTDDDDATISIEAVPLSVSSLSIEKMVRNQTANGVFDDMATGFAGDIFCYFVEITNDGETLLSNVTLIDDQATIGSQLWKTGSSTPLVWTDTGSGKAGISIGTLAPGESVSFTYRFTAKTEDEGEIILNTATVKAEYIPTVPGYENIPLEQSAEAAITLYETPPQTGESGTNGLGALGLMLLAMAGLLALMNRRAWHET